jgi:GH18 family chitinase
MFSELFNFVEKLQVEANFDANNEVEKHIVCYVEGIAKYRKEPMTFTPEQIDPYACTHVIYAFASLDPHSYQIITRDEEYDVVQGLFQLNSLLITSNVFIFRWLFSCDCFKAKKSKP